MATQVFSPPRGGMHYATKSTRQRVAQIGGFVCAIRKGDLFTVERAEKGGQAILEKYGQQIYAQLVNKRWRKYRTQEQRVKRLVVRDEKSGGYKCKRCGKKRNTLRSMQRHVKRHL